MTTDLAEEFTGEDILLPEQRQRVEDARNRLRDVAGKVALRRLPEAPGEEMVQVYRSAVEDSFRQLGYVED